MKKMNVKNIFVMLILGLLMFFHHIAWSASANLDKIVAVVNNDVITQSELDKRIALMQRQLGGKLSVSSLRQKALNDLIDIYIQLQIAKKNGINISDIELDAVVSNIAKSHNITLAKLKEILPKQEGISFADFRKQLHEQGIISRVQQRSLGAEVSASISEKDIDAVLRNPPKMNTPPAQYHVIDILFGLADGVSENKLTAVKKVANQMALKLQQGANIDAIVTASQNILKEQIVKSEDLGWRKVDELPELFAKEIATMKVNQVIGPISAPNGLHLLKLLAIQGPQMASSKLTRDQAVEIVIQRKLAEKVGPWLKEWRDKAYIKIIK